MTSSTPAGSPAVREPHTESIHDRVLLDVRDFAGLDGPGARVAYVTLARPEQRNGLDLPMLHALAETPKRIAADREIRAVVLQGAGPAFCAGLDFASVSKAGLPANARAFLKLPGRTTNLFQRACWAWRELPVPVIAVLHGACFGGGLQVALAADFRFATPDCRLSVMEGKWGLVPDMTGSVTMRELLGMDVAKRLAMTAEIIDATQAHEYGLVTGVADDPLLEAESLVAQLLTRSPDSVALTKRLFHDTWTRTPRRAFWTESVLQARLLAGKNHRRILAAKGAVAPFVQRTVR